MGQCGFALGAGDALVAGFAEPVGAGLALVVGFVEVDATGVALMIGLADAAGGAIEPAVGAFIDSVVFGFVDPPPLALAAATVFARRACSMRSSASAGQLGPLAEPFALSNCVQRSIDLSSRVVSASPSKPGVRK
jgi:hypothetical protein